MTLRPVPPGQGGLRFISFVVIFHDEVNALLLLRCKEAVGLKEASLVPVQVILLYMSIRCSTSVCPMRKSTEVEKNPQRR